MAKFKPPRKKETARPKQGAVPCLIIIGLIFAFLIAVFFAVMKGT